MNLKEIEAVIASYVDASKQAGTWSASTNNLAGLLDKIAKTVTIDGLFPDKLPQLDGEELPLGKTVEEYYQDLDSVFAYNDFKADASNAAQDTLKPYYPTYRPASYNYTLGRKLIPTTIKYDEYERACNSPEEFSVISSMILKRLYDSFAMFKYDTKKQILANLIAKVVAEEDASSATAYSTGDQVVAGTIYKSGGDVGICVKAGASAAGKTWANRISDGNIVVLNMIEDLGAVTDTESGEKFLEQVKKDIEAAGFASEGHSLNGNTVGAENGLMLIVKKGVKPILDVQVEAGAFNPEKLAVPAEIVVVEDFGNDANGVYAMLVDKRIARLHPTYFAVREQLNGIGDYVNYFLHTENTAFISKNCFVKIYK